MMKILNPIAATVLLALTSTAANAGRVSDIQALTSNDQPSYVAGNLGEATVANTVSALKNIISEQAAYKAAGNEGFNIKRQWTDKLGKVHTHVNQTINGLKVYGTSMIVHADKLAATLSKAPYKGALNAKSSLNNADATSIYSVSGTLAVNNDQAANPHLLARKAQSSQKAQQQAAKLGDITAPPELAYVYLPLSGETKLAWVMEVTWNLGGENFGRDVVFYDVKTNALLTRHAKVHSAKSWATYSLDNLEPTLDTLPGRELCINEEECDGDASAKRAHDGASDVYD
ncbi:MAG: Zn-dependent metalloprotease, partial [Phenylobacterium sp.]